MECDDRSLLALSVREAVPDGGTRKGAITDDGMGAMDEEAVDGAVEVEVEVG